MIDIKCTWIYFKNSVYLTITYIEDTASTETYKLLNPIKTCEE